MYRKEDVYNIRNNDRYELTELDERIYNETGYVVHQVDGIFKYKKRVDSVCANFIKIHKDGTIHILSGEWYFPLDGGKHYHIADKKLMELAKLKYQELIGGYWSETGSNKNGEVLVNE
jgi:hypothetical protein